MNEIRILASIKSKNIVRFVTPRACRLSFRRSLSGEDSSLAAAIAGQTRCSMRRSAMRRGARELFAFPSPRFGAARATVASRLPPSRSYCDAFVEKDNLYIVMEFAEGGDIGRQIEKFKKANKYIKEDTIWSYIIQSCRGLNEMHGRSILHRVRRGVASWRLRPSHGFL